MFVVAITRWGAALESELPALAEALELTLYDARLRLTGPLPVLAGAGMELPQAQALLGLLRGRGHGAVACDVAHLPAERSTLVPRSFEFHPDNFIAIDGAERRYALPYDDVLGLFRAVEVSEEHETTTTTERKFSMGRTVLTGGIMRHTKIDKTERRSSVGRQEVCYVFRRSGPEPMLLREHALRYEGLGEFRAPTVHQSFVTLLEWLTRYAPSAIVDSTLTMHRRRADQRVLLGTPAHKSVSWSNAQANGVAAHILVHAHLQGQL